MTTQPLTLDHAHDHSHDAEEAGDAADWVPQACTLPTVEQPLRVAEFDQLFVSALRGLDRLEPTRLRLRLNAAAEADARDLTDRETGCCSFFTFTFAPVGDLVLVDVSVPGAHVEVLDALAVRAAAAAGLGS